MTLRTITNKHIKGQTMKKLGSLLVAVLAACAVLFSAPLVQADEKADAVTMVKAAITYFNANGLEKALDSLNDPKAQFAKGELYVFAYDLAGNMLANSVKPALVGQNIIDVPDSAGKKFRKEILERAQKEGSGWVDYKTLNPKTKLTDDKTTYFERSGEVVFGCGIYKK
jgi:cytochrome c